jgi:hypothetical protein
MAQMFAKIYQKKKKHQLHVDDNHQHMWGSFTIPSYSGSYDGEKYFDRDLVVEQVFESTWFPRYIWVQQATNKFKDFSLVVRASYNKCFTRYTGTT